jgi:hypothetical protein
MARQLGLLIVMAGLSCASGCATCCAPYDDYYPAVGGRWVRDNPAHGRVGSAFAPAGHRVDELATASAEATPTEASQPGVAPLPERDGASYLPTDE